MFLIASIPSVGNYESLSKTGMAGSKDFPCLSAKNFVTDISG